jgi:hypothetical protein
MTRVARSVDLSEWLTRTEERLSTAERRLAAAQRPAQGVTSIVYGPNLLPNPDFEEDGAGTLAGWQNVQQGQLVSGSQAISGSWSFRMVHAASQPIITREKRSINIRPYAWRNYKGDNSWITAAGSDGNDHVWQGQFDAVNGNTRSYMWWDPAGFADVVGSIPGDWEFADLLIFWEHWFWSEGGTMILGAHTVAAPPAAGSAGPTTNSFPDLIRYSWPARYVWGSCSIIAVAGIADRIRDGSFRGIELGPGPTTNSTFYGYARPYDAQLRITYWKTTNISIGGLTSEVRSNGVGVSGGNVKWNTACSIKCTVAATAKLGVWWRNAGGIVSDVDVATVNLGADAIMPLSGTLGAAFSDAAVDVGCYVKITGAPPSDGSGSTIPWNYTVDDWILRQQIAG